MIISHKHKFIFFKTRKTAGTSVEIALSQVCGPEDIITPISADDEALRHSLGGRARQNYVIESSYGEEETFRFYNHVPASEVRKRIGPDIWNTYFKFCFERNPCEKIISRYYHSKKIRGFDMSLREFVNSQDLAEYSDWHIYTDAGRVIVDFVGQYEQLERDYLKVMERLGVTHSPGLPKAKGQFRQDRTPYDGVLGEEEIARIRAAFEHEFACFGY